MATASIRWWCRAAGLTFLLACLPGSAPVGIANAEMESRVRDIVAGNVAPEATADHPGGAASAVYIAGRVEFFNYGFADQAKKTTITSDTLFNIASMRKVFEATLVALGTLRGELRLDDPIDKYVTELRGDYIRRVTIGELASHTSGLLLAMDHPPWPNETYSLAKFLDILNAWTPHAGEQPGKQHHRAAQDTSGGLA